jgi:hypothetical protein
MGFLVKKLAHQFQFRLVSQEKGSEILSPISVQAYQGMQMSAV